MNPTLVVSMGDANGVGPEILLKSYTKGLLTHPFYAVGDACALSLASRKMQSDVKIHIMNSPLDYHDHHLNLLDLRMLQSSDVEPGKVSKTVGNAAKAYIESAVRSVLSGAAAAMVTLPVSKEAIQLSSPGFTGHTELIAQMCGQDNYTMMLASDKLTVTHVSTHVSMLDAVAAVRRDRVLNVIRLTRDALTGSLGRSPRIAVAGLNAHAGENGLFGREEIEHIAPAIADAMQEGMDASGPHPPDTIFLKASTGQYDAVVCMYHDQGHIPLKLLDFSGGVNVTLGLKIIRTSVDHGTAFDIAYKGFADTGSFVKAFSMAAAMVENRV